MRLCFLLERRYAPYASGSALAFARSMRSRTSARRSTGIVAASGPEEREQRSSTPSRSSRARHNALGLTGRSIDGAPLPRPAVPRPRLGAVRRRVPRSRERTVAARAPLSAASTSSPTRPMCSACPPRRGGQLVSTTHEAIPASTSAARTSTPPPARPPTPSIRPRATRGPSIAAADADDVDRAVRAARAAFEGEAWRGLSPTRRGRLMMRSADLIAEHAEAIAKVEIARQRQALQGDARPAAGRSPSGSTTSAGSRTRSRAASSRSTARASSTTRCASRSASSGSSSPGTRRSC